MSICPLLLPDLLASLSLIDLFFEELIAMATSSSNEWCYWATDIGERVRWYIHNDTEEERIQVCGLIGDKTL